MISSPLEAPLAARVGALDVVDELLYDPALLPPARYPNDHAGDPAFARDANAEARWQAMLARADVLFGYPGERADQLRAMLEDAPRVRFVQGTSAGMGAHVRRAALAPEVLERVKFASAAGVHAAMLAEFAFYGLLALRKDAARLARARAGRIWEHFVMGELAGSTLAIVGMGQIGGAIASRARAFEMRTIAVARTADPQPPADETVAIEDRGEAFARADAVVCALPSTDATLRLISRDVLARLPAHAIVVNVGRGTTLDQDALLEMLRAGSLAGAVLDVTDPEPLPPEHPFWTMENVVLSPHTAALSIHENERIVALFCDNLERLAAGRPLRNAINLTEFY